jgi:hypothetical protein
MAKATDMAGSSASSVNECVRKTHLICIGAAKTGTHTIAQMFDSRIKSSHEACAGEIISLVASQASAKDQRLELVDLIKKRDQTGRAEVDSSQLNIYLVDIFLSEYPGAKFVLTIRDCYTWLNSFINHSLRFPKTAPVWKRFRDFRFRSDHLVHPIQEAALKERGLYTLEGYLSYWTFHNLTALNKIPQDRLLIIKTNEISRRAQDIADFAGLPLDYIRHDCLHAFKSDQDFKVLHDLSEDYLNDTIQRFSGSLMTQFFPTIKSLADAGI